MSPELVERYSVLFEVSCLMVPVTSVVCFEALELVDVVDVEELEELELPEDAEEELNLATCR
jgi:hypothetical protein